MTHLVFPSGGGSGFINSVSDTDSVDLTVVGGNLSGDLRLSIDGPDPGFVLVSNDIRPGPNFGLRSQVSSTDIWAILSAVAPILYDPTTGVISSQPATLTDPGHVTITSQSFKGDKYFDDDVIVNKEFGHGVFIDPSSSGILIDYPTDGLSHIIFTSNTAITITSFAGGFDGKRLIVMSLTNFTLNHFDPAATPGMEINTIINSNLNCNFGIELIYSGVLGYWIPINRPVSLALPTGTEYGGIYTYVPNIVGSLATYGLPGTFSLNYADNFEFIISDPVAAGGDIYLDLPSSFACPNKTYVFKNGPGNSFSTFIQSSTDTIDGSPIVQLVDNESLVLRSTGSGIWSIVSAYWSSRYNRLGMVRTFVYDETNSVANLNPDGTVTIIETDNYRTVRSDCSTAVVGNFVELPKAINNLGRFIAVYVSQESSNPSSVFTTIFCPAGDLINYSATYVLRNTNDFVILVATSAGNWSVISSSELDITIDSPALLGNPNALSYSPSGLRVHPATVSTPGVVTTGSQTFSGDKSFNDRILKVMNSSNTAFFEDVLPVNLGFLVNDLESCTITLENEAYVFDIEVNGVGYLRASSCFNSGLISYIDDPMSIGLIVDAGTGVYLSKSAFSNSITIKSRLGASRQFRIRCRTGITGVTVWS